MRKSLMGLCAVLLVAGAFGQQLSGAHNPNVVGVSGGGVHASGDVTITLPNLIDLENGIFDPWTLAYEDTYRPQVINLDPLTIRDVLVAQGTVIDANLIVQTIRVTKVTPYLKCTAFVTGPGAGINTNFDSGLKKATVADLDKKLVNLAFGIPQDLEALGVRALLFSPPGTTYTLQVTYVVLGPNGRPGPPQTCKYIVTVMVPDRYKIDANVDFFALVAAGATQKPKIDAKVHAMFDDILFGPNYGDDLAALIAIETVIATYSIDFAILRDNDDRFYHDYLVDSDEEPIGCLLVEMANAALWH